MDKIKSKKKSFKLDSTLNVISVLIMRVLNYLRYNELKDKIAFDSIFFLLKFKDNNQNQSDEIQQNTPDQQPRLPKLKLKIAGPNDSLNQRSSDQVINKKTETTTTAQTTPTTSAKLNNQSMDQEKNIVKPLKISLVNQNNNTPNQNRNPNFQMKSSNQEGGSKSLLNKQQHQSSSSSSKEQLNLMNDSDAFTNMIHRQLNTQEQKVVKKVQDTTTLDEEIELGEIVRPKKSETVRPSPQQQQQQQQQRKIPQNKPQDPMSMQKMQMKKPQIPNNQQQQQQRVVSPQNLLFKQQQQQQQANLKQQQNASNNQNPNEQVPKM